MTPYATRLIDSLVEAAEFAEVAPERGTIRQMEESREQYQRAYTRLETYINRVQKIARKRLVGKPLGRL